MKTLNIFVLKLHTRTTETLIPKYLRSQELYTSKLKFCFLKLFLNIIKPQS